jgi:hypothetical protein
MYAGYQVHVQNAKIVRTDVHLRFFEHQNIDAEHELTGDDSCDLSYAA